jgi:carboxyl-terminal processing protease
VTSAWCSGERRTARSVHGLASIVHGLASIAAGFVLGACSGAAPGEDASASSVAAAGSPEATPDPAPPLSADCRSWAELDVEALAPLPESPWTADFERVWGTVREKHYDPTLGCLDWPKLREVYGEKVAAAQDSGEAFAAMNALLGTLGQSHLAAIAPSGGTGEALAVTGTALGADRLELDVRALDEGVIIAGPVYSADPTASAPAIASGAQLVAIDELQVDAWVAAVKGHPHPGESERSAVRGALARALTCPTGGRKSLTYLDPGAADARTTIELPCVTPAGERMSLGNLRDLPVVVEGYVVPGTKVGVLHFNVWMVPLVDRIRAKLDELRGQGIEALILDLRGNPGGVGAMAIPVARMLLPEGGDLGSLRMREFTQSFKVPASPDAFGGPVVVLVDEGTASTSEIFAVGMRDLGRLTVVGASPSAGAALPSLLETLPSGGLLQVVVGDYRSPKGTIAEGAGVPLDVTVKESRADWVAGRDPVLTAALVQLGAKPSTSPGAAATPGMSP